MEIHDFLVVHPSTEGDEPKGARGVLIAKLQELEVLMDTEELVSRHKALAIITDAIALTAEPPAKEENDGWARVEAPAY